MNDFYYFLISGGVLMLVPVLLIAYFQSGFFLKWLRARLGRGKYVLIKVRSPLRDYFDYGHIKGEYLIFGKKEETKRVLINPECIYRSYGVAVVDYDEATGALARANFEAIEGFDPEKNEALYIRALYRPSLQEDDKMMKVLLILIVIAIAAALASAFLSWNVSQQIAGMGGSGTVNTLL